MNQLIEISNQENKTYIFYIWDYTSKINELTPRVVVTAASLFDAIRKFKIEYFEQFNVTVPEYWNPLLNFWAFSKQNKEVYCLINKTAFELQQFLDKRWND